MTREEFLEAYGKLSRDQQDSVDRLIERLNKEQSARQSSGDSPD